MTRRGFVQGLGAASLAGLALRPTRAAETPVPTPENLVQKLFESLTPEQKEEVAFAWDYKDDRGLLRTHVSNNWQITEPKVAGSFYTKDQQDLIEAIFWGLYAPEWHARIRKQLKDDAGDYGKHQSIALFGEPGKGPFEFVMTGRHLTIRCDGNSTEHAAFGGPIFYGHAAESFNEAPTHPGNVFWPQALKANELYKILDGKQRQAALVPKSPAESQVHFRKGGDAPGLVVSELSADQRGHLGEVLAVLLEPYRAVDRDEVRKCLEAQGNLEKCRLSFYADSDLGGDGVWDNWRLEGPAFVWHFRGNPHVHVWANVADDPSFSISAQG